MCEFVVTFDGLDVMPAAEPLSADVKGRTDEDAEARAADVPDAGTMPPSFWD